MYCPIEYTRREVAELELAVPKVKAAAEKAREELIQACGNPTKTGEYDPVAVAAAVFTAQNQSLDQFVVKLRTERARLVELEATYAEEQRRIQQLLSAENLTGRDKALANLLRMDDAIRSMNEVRKWRVGERLFSVEPGMRVALYSERHANHDHVLVAAVEEEDHEDPEWSIAGKVWVALNIRGLQTDLELCNLDNIYELVICN